MELFYFKLPDFQGDTVSVFIGGVDERFGKRGRRHLGFYSPFFAVGGWGELRLKRFCQYRGSVYTDNDADGNKGHDQ